MNRKRCFIISPIGEPGSSTRVRSNQILNHLIRPAVEPLGFDVTRADEIPEPGNISTQVLERVLNDQLVIADLTGRNPNVYYELAVRHAVRKPVIQLIHKDEPLPFDIAGTRTILVDHKDLDSVADAKKQLAQYILNIEDSGQVEFDSPISLAMDLRAMRGSNDPQKAGLAEVTERVTSVHGSVVSIQSTIEKSVVARLKQVLQIARELRRDGKETPVQNTPSELGDRVESLRAKLVDAIEQILGEVQGQHEQLALKIQAVFQEQSETATQSVMISFADELTQAGLPTVERELLLGRLVDIFMHGMHSMGTFQHINVTKQAEASTSEIRDKIASCIDNVFGDIDEIEERILALPRLLAPPDSD